MRFVNTSILIILTGLIGGITITDVMHPSFLFALIACIGLIVFLALHYFLAIKYYVFNYGTTVHTFLCSIGVGMFVTVLHTPTTQPCHYTHFLSPQQYYPLETKVIEQTYQTDYGLTFRVAVNASEHQAISGEILCFFPSKLLTDEVKSLLSNDRLVVFGQYNPIAPPRNPYQFNFKEYMERKGIYGQVKVASFLIEKEEKSSITFTRFIEKTRKQLEETIATSFNPESTSLLKTLLLGKRSDLNEETYQNYIDAGAVHILAISGLHVGIITGILLFFLKKVPNIGVYRPLRYGILLVGVWSFALLAGGSPSVLRATVMFSFVGLSSLIERRQGRFDALMLSMLLLLLIQPNYLYEVGFQLSYAAVFSIMKFYPVIKQWFTPQNKLFRAIWSLFLVGASAQIVVIPISLYYFHQLPILFFLSNLIVVPLLQPILIGSIIAIFLSSLGILPSLLISALELLIHLMNSLVALIAHQEAFIIRNVEFNVPLFLSALLIVGCLIILVHYQNFKLIIAAGVCVFIFQGVLFYNKYQLETTEEMLVFSSYKQKIISIRQGKTLYVYQKDTTSLNPLLENYIKKRGLSDISIKPMPYVLRFKQKNYLLMDSLGLYPTSKQVVIDSVIFLQKPKINLDRMKQVLSLRY